MPPPASRARPSARPRVLALVPDCATDGSLVATLQLAGADLTDILAALDAARTAIADGTVIGFDRDGSARFSFFVEPGSDC